MSIQGVQWSDYSDGIMGFSNEETWSYWYALTTIRRLKKRNESPEPYWRAYMKKPGTEEERKTFREDQIKILQMDLQKKENVRMGEIAQAEIILKKKGVNQ